MKKSSILMLTVFFTLVLSIFIFPSVVYAQTGTLGNEKPQISASYTDGDGNLADGNQLTAGSYTMQIALTGMEKISQMELTATYGEEVSFGNYSTLADSNSNVDAVCSISSGNLVIGLVSKNADCTAIDSEKTVIFTASITVTSETAIDMENVISVSQNPNFTYLEADYGDVKTTGVYDCYALGTNADYAGTVHPMACDLSPQLAQEFSVSGKVVAMLNPDAPDDYTGAPALANVNVLINGSVVATTTADGVFTIPALQNGTYSATLHYANGLDRAITIIVNGADINYSTPITMVSCDYNNDGIMNAKDSFVYLTSLGSNDLVNGDLNGDGFVNAKDSFIFYLFLGKMDISSVYTEVTIIV